MVPGWKRPQQGAYCRLSGGLPLLSLALFWLRFLGLPFRPERLHSLALRLLKGSGGSLRGQSQGGSPQTELTASSDLFSEAGQDARISLQRPQERRSRLAPPPQSIPHSSPELNIQRGYHAVGLSSKILRINVSSGPCQASHPASASSAARHAVTVVCGSAEYFHPTPILRQEILDGVLLPANDPAGQDQEQQLPWLQLCLHFPPDAQ